MDNEITIKVMQWLESAAQQVGEFASKEIPPFVHEFLQWKFYEAVFDASTGFLVEACFIALLCCTKKMVAWAKVHSKQSFGTSYCAPILIWCAAVPGFFIVFPDREIKDMIQIKIAPKVYLVEKAAEILKSTKP
jgi:hypothetical protein